MKFLHSGICVSDINRSVKWYTELFNLKEERRFEKDEFEMKAAVLTNGETIIELIQPKIGIDIPTPADDLKEALRYRGLNHFAVSVQDLNVFYNKCKERSENILTDIINDRLFFLYDPDNTLIEIKRQ